MTMTIDKTNELIFDASNAAIMWPLFEALGGPKVAASFGNVPNQVQTFDTSTRAGVVELYERARAAELAGKNSFLNMADWEDVGPTLSIATSTPREVQHVLWVDIDRTRKDGTPITVNDALLKKLTSRGCMIVASPTRGNLHVYFLIDDAMDPDEWLRVNTLLKTALGGDAKQSIVSWLRLPYADSFKDKHIGRDGEPRCPSILKFDDRPWRLDRFEALLVSEGLSSSAVRVSSNDVTVRVTDPVEPRKRAMRGKLLAAFDIEDRSEATFAVVKEAIKAKFTIDEAAWVLLFHPYGDDIRSKKDGDALIHDIERIWPRAMADLEPARKAKRSIVQTGGTLKLRKASTVKIKKLYWLWQDRIPLGALCLLAGREGTGKSSVAYGLAAQVTRGAISDGHYDGVAKNVIICATEDAWETTIAPRLLAADADMERVLFFEFEEGERLALPTDNDEFADAVRNNDVGLVVFDPIVSVLDEDVDADKGQTLRRALEPINRIADETRCAFLGIAHFNKRTEGDMGMLLSGSLVWSQVARATIGLLPDPDNENGFLFLNGKNNNAPGDVPVLMGHTEAVNVPTDDGDETRTSIAVWDGEAEITRRELLGMATKGKGGSPIEQWLTDQLAEDDVPAKSILERGASKGFSEYLLRGALKKIGGETKRDGFGPGSTMMWRIPELEL